MISKDNIKFYLDPIQDLTCNPESVFVTEVMREQFGDRLVGTIVKVKKMDRYGRHYWWVTEDGDYVHGAPVSAGNVDYSMTVVALADDDVFMIGRVWDRSGTVAILEHVVRSDGKIVPATNAGARRRSDQWMLAAPWARECMPVPGDSDEVASLKLQLAMAHHKRRTAMRVILQESMERNWNEDLEELRDDHDIPKPIFGAKVNGYVMLPVESHSITVSELPEAEQEAIRAIGATVTRATARMALPVEFVVGTNANSREEFDTITAGSVTRLARQRFNRHDISMGDYSLSPILRKVS